jgi:adenosylcobyric acid synthase
MWHGAFENDEFRRAWLTATTVFRADPAAPGFRARREAMLDRLADAVEQHLDVGRLLDLVGVSRVKPRSPGGDRSRR